jgi:two-component system, cell cycle sensor histidine kinase and response regulator CckA
MPEMSGQRVAELLRQRHPHLPVVYMSGYTDGLLDVARIREQGSLFIEKPFTAHFLLTQIRDVFMSAGASLREC